MPTPATLLRDSAADSVFLNAQLLKMLSTAFDCAFEVSGIHNGFVNTA